MSCDFSKIIKEIDSANLSEKGGSHNQKGIEFQRYWAILNLFERELDGEEEYVFLFEVIQDVAVLNSISNIQNISVYQIKKKDRKEWRWGELTCLNAPNRKKSRSYKDFCESPIGKLVNTIYILSKYNVRGVFISNAKSDIRDKGGLYLSENTSACFDEISQEYYELLGDVFEEEGRKELLSLITSVYLERTNLPSDEPRPFVVGKAVEYLKNISEEHVGQASSLVETLYTKISSLSTCTDNFSDKNQLLKNKGYTREEFVDDISKIKAVSNHSHTLGIIMKKLVDDGMNVCEVYAIDIQISIIKRNQMKRIRRKIDSIIDRVCEEMYHVWDNKIVDVLRFCNDVLTIVEKKNKVDKAYLYAYIVIKISKNEWSRS